MRSLICTRMLFEREGGRESNYNPMKITIITMHGEQDINVIKL